MRLLSAALIAVFLFSSGLAYAATSREAKDKAGSKWQATADAELAYATNVYNLSSDQQSQLEANVPADQTSGRFNDMDSVEDFILTPGLKLSGKMPGLGGKEFQIKPGVAYNLYAQNTKKSHFELGLDMRHDLGDSGTLGLDISYAPEVFKKNYLADATDLVGPVADSERVYKPATYDSVGADLSYRHRLWKGGKVETAGTSIESVHGTVIIGFQNREFSAPFKNRDEDSVRAGAGLDMDFSNNLALGVSYMVESVETPAGTEVLILDEADFSFDFNGDSDILDKNLRSVQKVDRSRLEHVVAVKARIKLGKNWTGQARYDYRLQDYSSTERFDSTYANREDVRHRLGLGLQRELTGRLTLGLGWELVQEDTSRGPSPSIDPAEPKSYDAMTFTAGLSYRL